MIVAVTVWEDRISPVFDASRRILVAEIENARIGERSYLIFDATRPFDLSKTLTSLDVSVLICGAISDVPAKLMTAGGIRLLPFISGAVDQVLKVYAEGGSLAPAYVMPGCGGSVTD